MKIMFMNRYFNFVAVMSCCLAILLSACTKDKPIEINSSKDNLFGTIMADKQLNLYRTALKRAGMLDSATFSNGGPFTVFAAQDSAFLNAGLTADSINKMNPENLALLLRYSMVYGRISSSTLVGFFAQDVDCRYPSLKPRLNKNYYGIFFNGIPVITPQSQTLTDGVLHELNRMPFPQNGTLLDLIHAQPELTIFSAILKRTGNETLFTTPGPNNIGITVLAPNDEAYKKYGISSPAAVDNADLSVLSNQLRDMWFSQKFYTADFIGGYSFNYNFFFVKSDGFTIVTVGNILPTHILRPDLLATNGTLQIVDQVFLVRK